jgi:thiosulfate/3-mercaptopyruvate sulfurtransferase
VRWTAAKPAYQKACASCHATCGDCHVSRPPYSNGPLILGGLQNGHLFAKTPPMALTCNGCHGGRVAAEFSGQYEGFPADVHFTKAKMTCTDCHPAAQMHGDGTTPANRFAVTNGPECVNCHPEAAPGKGRIPPHNVHGGSLACQVCHSTVSKSCNNCHAGQGATSFPALKIGLNLRPELPHKYVVLRHVPTARDMIDRLTGLVNTIQNFDRVPTWKTATPHNIQRVTARSQSCAACHNNPNLFLRLSDLNPNDSQTNGRVVTGPAVADSNTVRRRYR